MTIPQAIDTERLKQNPTLNMIPILEHLKTIFDVAIRSSFPELEDPPTTITQVSPNLVKFGDYQCNSPLALTKILKTNGVKFSPKEIAEKIVTSLPKLDLIGSVNIANAGFINIFLSKYVFINITTTIFETTLFKIVCPNFNQGPSTKWYP